MEESRILHRVCNCCGDIVEDKEFHVHSPLHKFNDLLLKWKSKKEGLKSNRHGVEFIVRVNGTNLKYNRKKGEHTIELSSKDFIEDKQNKIDFDCIASNKRNDPVEVSGLKVLIKNDYFDNNNNEEVDFMNLEQNASYSAKVRFAPDDNIFSGEYLIPVVFLFRTKSEEKQDTFYVYREIVIKISNEILEQVEVTESPYKGKEWENNVQIINSILKEKCLDKYPIPERYKPYLIKLCQLDDLSNRISNELRKKLRPGYVTVENYTNFWKVLLWCEELQQIESLRQFNMVHWRMEMIYEETFEMVVPGLSEKRPSVIKGDKVDVRYTGNSKGYRGIITDVGHNTIQISHFDQELVEMAKSDPNILQDIDVRFILSRLALERQHRGIDQVVFNGLVPYLFPETNLKAAPIRKLIFDKDFFNRTIAENREQKTAVKKILNVTFPCPYVLFGPPGTGKTVTLVEAILQYKKTTRYKILACAPSNAACDLIADQLLQGKRCKENELLRYLAKSVDISTVPKNVLKYSNCKDGEFERVSIETLKTYRIIVSTLMSVGKFSEDYKPDVIFIDEAAQASEPEVCVALGSMGRGKKIILAGDPKQLGPSLASNAAKEYKLGVSILERLMDCDLYKESNDFKTMLIQNFRNHSQILEIPNKLFYDNKLEAMSALSENDELSKIFVFENFSKKLKKPFGKKACSVEFCNVTSRESKEGKSPSFYNTSETEMTLKYIETLLSLKLRRPVKQSDIGVVTPYARQAYKMKAWFKNKGFHKIEVGTTETFQGREKRIIIISTVRAKNDLLLPNGDYQLGFLKDQKRFNVAVTRAMSKLIVIGCAHVLASDDSWSEYIEFCKSIGTFCGDPFNRRTLEVMEEISASIEPIRKDTQFDKS